MTAPLHNLAAELARAERHLAEALAIMASVRAELEPASGTPVRAEDLLDTVTLAQRFRLTRGQIARLCEHGAQADIAGIVKRGRKWSATPAAINQARELKRLA